MLFSCEVFGGTPHGFDVFCEAESSLAGNQKDNLVSSQESSLENSLEGKLEGKLESKTAGKVGSVLEGQEEGSLAGNQKDNLENSLENSPENSLENNLESKLEGKSEGKTAGKVGSVLEGQDEGSLACNQKNNPESKSEGSLAGKVGSVLEGQDEGGLAGDQKDNQVSSQENNLVSSLEGKTAGKVGSVLEGQAESSLAGNQKDSLDTTTFQVTYRWDVDDSLDVAYLNNQKVLEALAAYLWEGFDINASTPQQPIHQIDSHNASTPQHQIHPNHQIDSHNASTPQHPTHPTHQIHPIHPIHQIDSITILAYASPEGGYQHNQELSRNRARYFRDYIMAMAPEELGLTEEMFRLEAPGENWEGLAEAVERGYWRHDREKVLKILRATNVGPETRKWRLQQLDGGYTYNFLIRRFMPELRYAASVIFYEKGGAVRFRFERIERLESLDDRVRYEYENYLPGRSVEYVPGRTKRVVAALKTNLLYDAATAINYSIELPLSVAGENFSLVYDAYFPWWLSDDNRRCLEYLALGGEARWWFRSDNTLQGHYLGAYAFSGKADLQKDRIGCYQFELATAGLSYGYSMPLCSWLNVEFSLSVGYARIPYRHYNPTDDWQILIIDHDKEGVMHYFGPTRACVTLTVPISIKYRLPKK